MLTTFIIFLFTLFAAEVGAGVLSLIFKNKFTDTSTPVYLRNLTKSLYGRDSWATPLIDTIQYYQECCGALSGRDYAASWWQIERSVGNVQYVPESCCVQTQTARPPHNLQPIDPRCVYYKYDTQPYLSAVHVEAHTCTLHPDTLSTGCFAGLCRQAADLVQSARVRVHRTRTSDRRVSVDRHHVGVWTVL